MSRDLSEKNLAEMLGGQLTSGSGAAMDDADIRYKKFLIECKRRDNNSHNIVFYPKFWDKLIKQAIKHYKLPAYCYITENEYFIFIDKVLAFQLYKKWIIYKAPYKGKVNYNISLEDYDRYYYALKARAKEGQEIGIIINNWMLITVHTFKRITNEI